MRTIGIRELRQQASRHLREVEAGETIEVTDRGRPVARIVPVPRAESIGEQLIASGRATRGRRGAPLPTPVAPAPGTPTLSEVLADLRADDR